MQKNWIYLVALGALLAGAEIWVELSKRQTVAPEETRLTTAPVKAHAREAKLVSISIASTPTVSSWKTQVGEVLNSEVSVVEQADTLLAMLPSLPPQGQVEVAQHSSRLLPPERFEDLGEHLTNAMVSSLARRAIFADLLTRPNSVKLPWLITVAEAAVDEQAEEALFLLASHLREDHGTNWNIWRQRVAVWLSANPE